MEEQRAPTGATEGASTTADEQPAVVSQAPVAATQPDPASLLDTIDPDTLMRHPRVAGILGSRIDQAMRKRQADLEAEARRKAEAEQDEELTRLLDENDETLAQSYPKARERLQALRQARSEEALQRRIGESTNEFANRVGQAYAALPEWREFSDEHRQRLRSAVEQNAADQAAAIGAFARTAADIVAEIRAEKKVQARIEAEREATKKAVRQELSAEALAGTPASGLKRPSGLPSTLAQIRSMTPQQIEELWRKKYG